MSNKNTWQNKARVELANLALVVGASRTIPADIIRRFIEIRIGKPPHYNSWGALFQYAVNGAGMFLASKAFTIPSLRKQSKGRAIKVYSLYAGIAFVALRQLREV